MFQKFYIRRQQKAIDILKQIFSNCNGSYHKDYKHVPKKGRICGIMEAGNRATFANEAEYCLSFNIIHTSIKPKCPL